MMCFCQAVSPFRVTPDCAVPVASAGFVLPYRGPYLVLVLSRLGRGTPSSDVAGVLPGNAGSSLGGGLCLQAPYSGGLALLSLVRRARTGGGDCRLLRDGECFRPGAVAVSIECPDSVLVGCAVTEGVVSEGLHLRAEPGVLTVRRGLTWEFGQSYESFPAWRTLISYPVAESSSTRGQMTVTAL